MSQIAGTVVPPDAVLNGDDSEKAKEIHESYRAIFEMIRGRLAIAEAAGMGVECSGGPRYAETEPVDGYATIGELLEYKISIRCYKKETS